MKKILLVLTVILLLASCSKSQTRPYQGEQFAATNPVQVEVLNSFPSRPHLKIGTISVRKYKPGFGEPTVVDAHELLKNAGGELGANAVVVINSNSTEQRQIIVEAEAIRYSGDR